MIDDSKAIKTHSVEDGFAETLERIKQARNAPETTKCPQCKKDKLPGAKCGCELVAVEKIVPSPMKLICDKCGGAKLQFYTKIQYPNDGLGVFTFLKGYKYPYPGWADQHLVDLDAIAKRSLMAFIKLFPWDLLFFRERFIRYFSEIANVAWKPIGHPQAKHPPTGRFCQSGREILRVGEVLLDKYLPKKEGEQDYEDTKRNRYRNFLRSLVMTWEFDNAYRFRGQDLLSEIRRENLLKNYRKEIIRIIKIGKQREQIDGAGKNKEFTLGKKWKLLLFIAYIGLYLFPKTSKFLKEFLLEINYDEVRPDKGDWYFMSERFDYNFGGISYEERLKSKLKEDEEWLKEHPINTESKPTTPVLEINSQVMFNDLFWEQDADKAKEMLQAKIIKLTEDLNTNFMNEITRRKNEKTNKS